MPEHAHLLVCPRDQVVDLGYAIGKVKEAVARKAISYLEQNAPHWLNRITVQEGSRKRGVSGNLAVVLIAIHAKCRPCITRSTTSI